MFQKGISPALIDQIKRNAERDVAIRRTASAAEEQADIALELLKHAERAEQRAQDAESTAGEALQTAAAANVIAVISIIISSLLAIVGIIVAVSIGIAGE
ncbi:hypothetical protein ACONUD_02750 [Microbulbifer harenosus]|uniref:Uncharacterized protein n=1 Tax=Microbulbifer harenosus TaxID=2576840 RepID=A0ABY2UEW6_9GAMM|nr:hypothetical protein [Microbulbifer harenosus]TLM73425.1 hypothetical protein FDY93_18910 [Microbulbifer harenosus]